MVEANAFTDSLPSHYRIERELGRGGMAVVFLATDLKHDRKVAIKVLRPDVAWAIGAERFLQEIRIAAQLNHPHIVPVHDSGVTEESMYYVMPYVDGESLHAKLEREGRLTVEEALRVAQEIGDALDYAHRCGVVHRDIKPHNILLHEGHAALADFGIARAVTAASDERITQVGMVVGTPAYMSPEQAAGDSEVDGRSDVFTLACVVFESLAGVSPFPGATSAAQIARRFSGGPASLRAHRPEVSEKAERAFGRALAFAPTDRFDTAGDFVAALTAPAAAGFAADKMSIVVLPFTNLSSDPENEYFSDGLTEEIIADLSQVKAMRVISRTSAMQLKRSTESLPAIGKRLGVRYVLEGGVRKSAGNLRITAQLIDAASEQRIWGDKYSGTLDDVFALQEHVARAIVSALDVTLTSDEELGIAARGISDASVYDCYLRARHEIARLTPASLDRADALLRKGLEIAPTNALLHALQGYALVSRLKAGASSDTRLLDRAEDHARQAIAGGVRLPHGHFVRGHIAYERGRLSDAMTHLRRALDLDAGYSDALFYLGITYVHAGRVSDARLTSDRLLAVDPLMPLSWSLRGVCRWLTGEFAAAVEPMEKGVELDQENPFARWLYAYTLALNGRIADAAVHSGILIGAAPGWPYAQQLSALIASLQGRASEADALRRSLASAPLDHHLCFHVAESHAVAGDVEGSLKLLERSIQLGYHPYEFIAVHNPFLAALRAHKEWKGIVHQARSRCDALSA